MPTSVISAKQQLRRLLKQKLEFKYFYYNRHCYANWNNSYPILIHNNESIVPIQESPRIIKQIFIQN